MLYTHNWALFFGAACGLVWLYLLWRSEERRRDADPRRDRLRRRAGAVPAVDPDHALPGGPHRRAVVGVADRRRPARDARHDARAVRVGGAAARRRRRAGRAPAAAGPLARGVAAGHRAADRHARVDVVAALAGVGQPLPDGRGGAAAAGRRGRARARRPARDRRPDRRRPAGDRRRGARRQEQRARGGADDRAEPARRRPRDRHPARADRRARLLPARGRALRDAHRRRERHRA